MVDPVPHIDLGDRPAFVASNGGHLEQLVRWHRQTWPDLDGVWVTFDSPQSRDLLADRTHEFISEIPNRGFREALAALPSLRSILARHDVSSVVSTGAAIAAPAFAAGRSLKVPRLYIESISRVEGPSLTGRLVATSRLASEVWTQHPGWASRRWLHRGSIFDGFERIPREPALTDRRVLVTLGTLKKYRFDAAVDRLLEIGVGTWDVTWQTGCTERVDLPGRTHSFIHAQELDELALAASAVVSHAGVGSVLRLLDLGIYPILLIRRSARGEHVDDHQEQIAEYMQRHGLAIVREVGEITSEDLAEAAKWSIVPRGPAR